ncbi:MAG: dTDP-4-dehydrorhamnose reductase [Wenzhouxiangella sp.]
MRVLLTGADGQLGRHLAPRLRDAGLTLLTSSRAGGDFSCELGEPDAVAALLEEAQPELIINAAAWTAVDAAEDHVRAAYQLNAELPAALASWCHQHDAGLIHYSTDYVFNGAPDRPWREDDTTAPASVYGASKLAGEDAIRASGARALILRTAWLYSALPGNFLSAILGRAAGGQSLRVVADQIGSPTWSGSLASITCDLLPGLKLHQGCRILHGVDRGQMSWYEFAGLAVELAVHHGVIEQAVAVAAIRSDEWPQRARRPRWSVLDVERTEEFLGRPVSSTVEALSSCLRGWKTMSC